MRTTTLVLVGTVMLWYQRDAGRLGEGRRCNRASVGIDVPLCTSMATQPFLLVFGATVCRNRNARAAEVIAATWSQGPNQRWLLAAMQT